jgi:DNA-binding transcriptional LysR family regulator
MTDDSLGKLSRLDLNLLVSMQALLEERSVTVAAQRIGLTQSAMSHALGRCRRMFGDELLVRVGAQMELTSRAHQLLAPLSAALAQINHEVLGATRFEPREARRTFTISLSSAAAMVVVPPLLRRVVAEAPHVTLKTVPGLSSGQDFARRADVDLFLVPDSVPISLPRQRLYTDEWIVIADPALAGMGEVATLDDLATLPHVAFEAEGMTIAPVAALEALGIRVDVRLRVHDFHLIPAAISGSGCLAIAQRRLVHTFAPGSCRVMGLPMEVAPLLVDLVWNPRVVNDPARSWLRDQLVASVAEG